MARRIARIIGLTIIALALATAPAFAEGNPPSVECGSDDPAYNKIEFQNSSVDVGDTLDATEFSTPPGNVLEITKTDADSYDYDADLPDGWALAKIVVKGGNDPDIVVTASDATGSFDVPENVSHVTFCFVESETDTPETPETPETPSTSVGSSTQTQKPTKVLGEKLAATGSDAQAFAFLGAALLVVGAGALTVSRREEES